MALKNCYAVALFVVFLFSATQVKSQSCGCNFDSCTQELDCCRGVDCIFDNTGNGFCIGECSNSGFFEQDGDNPETTIQSTSATESNGKLTEDVDMLSGLLIATLVFVIVTCCFVCIFIGILCMESRKEKTRVAGKPF